MPVSASFAPHGFSASASQLAALKVENSRLHRDNARLLNEVKAKEHGSYEMIQVNNSKLMHQVSTLQQELAKSRDELQKCKQEVLMASRTHAEEVRALQQEIQRLQHEAPAAQAGPVDVVDGGVALEPLPSTDASSPAVTSAADAASSTLGAEGAAPAAEGEESPEAPSTPGRASPIPVVNVQRQRDWTEHQGDQIEHFLRSGAYTLLDAAWLVSFAERFDKTGKPLPPRKSLPSEAFMPLEALKAAGCPYDLLPLFIVSCPWLTPAHPDPRGFYVKLLARAIRPLLANGQKYAVFWDWASVWQAADQSTSDMDPADRQVLQEGIRGLPTLYAHPFVTVLQLTEFPEDYPDGKKPDGHPLWDLPTASNVHAFFERGWCYTEAVWASWPCRQVLDLGLLLRTSEQVEDRRSLFRLCGTDGRMVPMLKDTYKGNVDKKGFLNVKEDEPLLLDMYAKSFAEYFGSVRKLDYSGLRWTDEEVHSLCDVLNSGVLTELEWLHLTSNKITDTGMLEIAEVVASDSLPKCTVIALEGNPGDPTPVNEALIARAAAEKDAQMQKMFPALA